MTRYTPGITWEEARAQDPAAFHAAQMRGGEATRAHWQQAQDPDWLTCDAKDFERWLKEHEREEGTR